MSEFVHAVFYEFRVQNGHAAPIVFPSTMQKMAGLLISGVSGLGINAKTIATGTKAWIR